MTKLPPPVHLLLLGAGFTRNWGGWLARELEGDILQRLRAAV